MDRLPPLKPRAPGSATQLLARKGPPAPPAPKRSAPLHPHALVVSLHDVSPHTHAACDSILKDLEGLGVKRCSLLVIPDHHGKGHFLESEPFCAWLLAQVEKGHEVVMHGYFHLRERHQHESWVTQLTTQVYTAQEGEFYDLDRGTAAARLAQAREDFGHLGLTPEGFIAPAWLLGSEAQEAVRAAGCEYTTRLQTVTDLRTGQQTKSQSLVWSVRSAWRRTVSLAWNAMLFRGLASNPLMRISIHPVDLQYTEVWAQIRSLVGKALRERTPYTYERWITRERTFRAASQG